ncbi:RagB/SusD family nutrient uptake outer membrane protein [Dysgonomonas sp. BGC7]|nr:RagB/SusD family nutrient uptake outer membrane protein [Dysgonomonas sp. BGC7]
MTMKKIYITILFLAGIIYSCNDLDEVIYTYTDQNAFVTQDNAIEAVNGIYQPLHSVSARAIFYLNDMTTDACFKKEMDTELLNELKMSDNGDVANSWLGYYQMVGRANIAIDNIPTIPDERFVAAKPAKNRLIAEAHFMRAFAYYQLTDLFYTVPLIVNSKIAVDTKIPPSSIEDIEQQIEYDLLMAKNSLPQDYGTTADAGRPTLGATYGMLCRLYMRAAGRTRLNGGDATAKWQSALHYANEVLTLRDKGVYSLQPKVWNVFDPSKDETLYNNEILFAVRSRKDLPNGSSDIGMNFTPWNYDMGWDLFSVPLELAWKFDKADQRFTELLVTNFKNVYDEPIYYRIPASIEEVGKVYALNVPSAGERTLELDAAYTKKYKYLRPGSYNYNTNNNMVILRLADIILCKAEILNELNGPSQDALNLVNNIRERAFQNTTHNLQLINYTSKEGLRSAICDERLFELNNEGSRRPDLIRMGLWKNRMDGYIAQIKTKSEWRKQNSTDPNADFSSEWKVYPNDLKENDIRRYFPVPKRESDLNPALLNCRTFTK